MDPELADFLTDIAIIAGGMLTGLGVAYVTASRTRALERERWRRDLYARFIADADRVQTDGSFLVKGREIDSDRFRSASERGFQTLSEIWIVAPQVEKAATNLWSAVSRVGAWHRERGVGDSEAFRKANRAANMANVTFINAAKRDLA